MITKDKNETIYTALKQYAMKDFRRSFIKAQEALLIKKRAHYKDP